MLAATLDNISTDNHCPRMPVVEYVEDELAHRPGVLAHV